MTLPSFGAIKLGIAFILGVLSTVIANVWITYVDDTVVRGSAYGLDIGSTRTETYEKVFGAIQEMQAGSTTAFIEIQSNDLIAPIAATRSGYTILVQSYLHDVGRERFLASDNWNFYINGSRFNSLKLSFCDDRLCEIHRHRQNFELP